MSKKQSPQKYKSIEEIKVKLSDVYRDYNKRNKFESDFVKELNSHTEKYKNMTNKKSFRFTEDDEDDRLLFLIKDDTLLHLFVRTGFFEIVRTLVNLKKKLNINIDAKNNDGETALHIAGTCENDMYVGERQCLPIVDILLSNGANINVQNKKGDTVLHNAASNAQFELVKKLVNNNIDYFIKNKKKHTVRQMIDIQMENDDSDMYDDLLTISSYLKNIEQSKIIEKTRKNKTMKDLMVYQTLKPIMTKGLNLDNMTIKTLTKQIMSLRGGKKKTQKRKINKLRKTQKNNA